MPFFCFSATAPSEISTLSLHDALPILRASDGSLIAAYSVSSPLRVLHDGINVWTVSNRSEEHTSELQSHHDLVCRLLLEKKKVYGRALPRTTHSNSGTSIASSITTLGS